jgi:cysteine-S-conjugate beta-lyase
MEYEFDQLIDRKNTHSIKWDAYPPDVLPMWIADMDFKAPPFILEQLHERINHGIFGYESDFLNLKQILVRWTMEHYHWEIKEEEIMIIPGVVTGLNLAAQSLGQPGEDLVIQTPVYPPFFGIGPNAQMEILESPLVESTNGFYKMDFEKLDSAITQKTRFLVLCNPHNPVGRVFTKEELSILAEICIRKNLIVISDEIHCDLVFDGRNHIPIASLRKEIAGRTITLMAPSKTFNIAGLKCSFMIIQDPGLRKCIEEGKRGLVGCPSAISMEAAFAAYSDGEEWMRQLIAYLQKNRDFLVSFIHSEIPQIKLFSPQATYLAWLDCRALGDELNPYEFFLSRAKIAFNDGSAFGKQGRGFIRLNFGCPMQTLEHALHRMKKSVIELT